MRALVFCAGNGTRLRPLTDKVPKPMIYVAGKPVLEHIVKHLNSFGITQIIVNLHYKPKPIMEYFGNRLLYFYEPILLGEKETERRLAEMGWLGEQYICMNGDTLTDIDINKMIEVSNVNKNSVYSFDKVYTGVKVVWRGGEKLKENFNCYWLDIGNPRRLQLTREFYATKDERQKREIHQRIHSDDKFQKGAYPVESRKERNMDRD